MANNVFWCDEYSLQDDHLLDALTAADDPFYQDHTEFLNFVGSLDDEISDAVFSNLTGGTATRPTTSTGSPSASQSSSELPIINDDPPAPKKAIGGRCRKRKADNGQKVAFRTMSEVDIMNDGYRWRKYGKKAVKDSPNPRNYYRCFNGDCTVKKRVERDGQDSRYVITTYEGLHNHDSPYIIYINL